MSSSIMKTLNGYEVHDPKSPHCYNTIADMKANSDKIFIGEVIQTLGRTHVEDSLGALFRIVTDSTVVADDERNEIYVLDGDKIAKRIDNYAGIPIGTIIPFAGRDKLPVGYLLCNGNSLSRTTYSALFAVIGTTYGAIDEDHFNLPNLLDKFIEGGNTPGMEKEAGLPNIEGSFEAIVGGGEIGIVKNANGAFGPYKYEIQAIDSSSVVATTGTGTTRSYGVAIDASRSNPIYGNSNTVQPPALTMRYIIKAFTGVNESIDEINVTDLANELNSKLDTNGGVMNGSIKFANNNFTIGYSDEYQDNIDIGWSYLNGAGAGIGLRGANYHTEGLEGSFCIFARDNTEKMYGLEGKTDGSLLWLSKHVITEKYLENIEFITPTMDSSRVDDWGSYAKVYKAGKFVFAHVNIRMIAGTVSSGTKLMSGFPRPSTKISVPSTGSGGLSFAMASTSASAALGKSAFSAAITQNGDLVADAAITFEQRYYDGFICYLTD